jgi:hypothetical protein
VNGKYPNEYYRTVCGTWQYVDDFILDAEYNEIMEYRNFRNILQNYVSFLLNQLASEDRQSLDTCQSEVDKLNYWFDTIPGRYDLVTSFRHPIYQKLAWCYNTSYLTFSSTNRLTRSWLVANLPTIVRELNNFKTTFTNQLPADKREEHENLYNSLMTVYENWRKMAEPRVKVPFHNIQRRELVGRNTNMQGMLEELRLCNV